MVQHWGWLEGTGIMHEPRPGPYKFSLHPPFENCCPPWLSLRSPLFGGIHWGAYCWGTGRGGVDTFTDGIFRGSPPNAPKMPVGLLLQNKMS